MEGGLRSADPKDCTAYTGWAGRVAGPKGQSGLLGQAKADPGVLGCLNNHSRPMLGVVLLMCALIH